MNVVVLRCREEAGTGQRAPEVGDDVHLVDDLCLNPDQISQFADGADRLVLIMHWGRYDLAALQTGARTAGIDPLGVQVIDLSEEGAIDDGRLRVIVAGARARARRVAASEPEHARPSFATRVSRRSVLAFAAPFYEPVPLVDHGLCAAGDGCRACVAVCPQDAYSSSAGRVRFDRDACVPCGRCVTTCPTGAISNPAAAPSAIRAQVDAIVDTAVESVGIVFVCKRGTHTEAPEDWFEVEVPCTSMVPGTWLLACLLLGAATATALPCAVSGCSLAQDDATHLAVDFARTALLTAGVDQLRVPTAPGEISWPPMKRAQLSDPLGTQGASEVLATLAALSPEPANLHFEHAGSPVGQIVIDPSACTLCGMCAGTCPTGALGHAPEDGHVSLTFDPSTCTACEQCLPVCPELRRGAIELRRLVDVTSLKAGRRVVNEGESLVCDSCGAAIAPSPLMDRIAGLLGEEHAAASEFVSRRCMDCRGLG